MVQYPSKLKSILYEINCNEPTVFFNVLKYEGLLSETGLNSEQEVIEGIRNEMKEYSDHIDAFGLVPGSSLVDHIVSFLSEQAYLSEKAIQLNKY